MKRKIIAMAIPALIMASTSTFAAIGESSTVNFTGNITEATCSLTNGGAPLNVDLGDVAANAFKGYDSVAGAKDFTIELQDCSTAAASTAAVTFSGPHHSAEILLTSGSAIANVGVQILQGGKPIRVDGYGKSTPVTLVDGANSLPFTAQYIALSDNVGSGVANASANFVMDYE